MLDFMKELTNQFRAVTAESYHERNRKKTVTYPYLTFDFDSEYLGRNVDSFYIDVDIFDNNASYTNIFALEEALKVHFSFKRKLTDKMFIRFQFLASNKVPTGDVDIKRRNIRIYCKIDWRA